MAAGVKAAILAALVCALLAAQAQGVPGGLPGGISGAEAAMLFQMLTPQQKMLLATGAVRGKDSLTPADAMAWYQSMTPEQKAMAKDWAKQKMAEDPSLVDRIKALLKGYMGR
jgi:hypothetical protein